MSKYGVNIYFLELSISYNLKTLMSYIFISMLNLWFAHIDRLHNSNDFKGNIRR